MNFGLSSDIYNEIKKIVNKFNNYKFVMFGSRVKNTYKSTSDIDIAVFENVSQDDEFEIRNQFDLLNIVYKIDLVFINNNTKTDFVNEIKEEGIEIL